MENRHFLDTFLRFFIVFEGLFVHNYTFSKRMSTKPIYLCSTLNFGKLDNNGNPEGVGIVFLYNPGTDSLDFHLCTII